MKSILRYTIRNPVRRWQAKVARKWEINVVRGTLHSRIWSCGFSFRDGCLRRHFAADEINREFVGSGCGDSIRIKWRFSPTVVPADAHLPSREGYGMVVWVGQVSGVVGFLQVEFRTGPDAAAGKCRARGSDLQSAVGAAKFEPPYVGPMSILLGARIGSGPLVGGKVVN